MVTVRLAVTQASLVLAVSRRIPLEAASMKPACRRVSTMLTAAHLQAMGSCPRLKHGKAVACPNIPRELRGRVAWGSVNFQGVSEKCTLLVGSLVNPRA